MLLESANPDVHVDTMSWECGRIKALRGNKPYARRTDGVFSDRVWHQLAEPKRTPTSLDHEGVEYGKELATSRERPGGVLPLAGLVARESDEVLSGLHELVGTRDLHHLLRGLSGELQESLVVFVEPGSPIG